MAFHATQFQTPYGFSLLDELHNFFPELLYDDVIFQGLVPRFLRHRTHELFPQPFTREQNMYRLYLAQNRRARSTSWYSAAPPSTPRLASVQNRAPAPSASPAPAAPATEPTPAPTEPAPATPSRPTRTPVAPNAPARPQRPNDAVTDLLTTLLSMPLNENMIVNDARNYNMFNPTTWTYMGTAMNLENLWQDVEVAPTADQIERGSQQRDASAVPADVTCAICMERGDNDIWRRLHCSHYFHDTCISRWLRRNVACPVCRTDIRDVRETDSVEE